MRAVRSMPGQHKRGDLLKMKRIYQLTDELALGSELQLQRWRDLLERLRQHHQARGAEPLPEALRGQIQGLMEEIDETTEELAALRIEVGEALHLKQFDLHRFGPCTRRYLPPDWRPSGWIRPQS